MSETPVVCEENVEMDPLELLTRAPKDRRNRPLVLAIDQIWGDALLDERQFPKPRAVTIGATVRGRVWADDFVVPSLDERFVLARWDAGWVARLRAEWDGFVEMAGERLSFEEVVARGLGTLNGGIFEIRISDKMGIVAGIGGMSLYVRLAPREARAAPAMDVDWGFMSIGVAAAMLFVIIGALLVATPPVSMHAALDDQASEAFLVEFSPPPPPAVKKATVGEGDVQAAKPGGGDPGKARRGGPKRERPAGLLGALEKTGFEAMIGGPGLPGGIEAAMDRMGAGGRHDIGNGGLGDRGEGFGGPGTAEGIASVGTCADCSSYGVEGGGAKQEGSISLEKDVIVMGGIDRSAIDEVVRRNMNQIRYCYIRELQKARNPDAMAGKVVIKFVIARDGSVSRAETKSSSLGNAAVEDCLEGRFLRMQFPALDGGGMAVVSYPFVFAPG